MDLGVRPLGLGLESELRSGLEIRNAWVRKG